MLQGPINQQHIAIMGGGITDLGLKRRPKLPTTILPDLVAFMLDVDVVNTCRIEIFTKQANKFTCSFRKSTPTCKRTFSNLLRSNKSQVHLIGLFASSSPIQKPADRN